MKSLLSNVKKADVQKEPFPHIVIHDPLDEELCNQLIAEYPSIKAITKGKQYSSNERFSYSATDVQQDESITPTWKELVRIHTSQEFMIEFLDLFWDDISKFYPDLVQKDIQDWKAGVRQEDTFANSDLLLDAQICVNTPVVATSSSVKGAHVDRPNKLFAALYYLRLPEDNSTGGNLEIYKFKDESYKNKFPGRQFIEDKYVELVKTVKYEKNVLVFLLNTLDSLHGVSARSVTDSPRLFFNLLGEIDYKLFDLGKRQQSIKSNEGQINGYSKIIQGLRLVEQRLKRVKTVLSPKK